MMLPDNASNAERMIANQSTGPQPNWPPNQPNSTGPTAANK